MFIKYFTQGHTSVEMASHGHGLWVLTDATHICVVVKRCVSHRFSVAHIQQQHSQDVAVMLIRNGIAIKHDAKICTHFFLYWPSKDLSLIHI